MSAKLSLAVLIVVWLGYIVFAGSYYAKTFALFG